MNHNQFIDRVQSRGHMGSGEEAERAIRAVLIAIREHVNDNESDELASQLPQEVSGYLGGKRSEHGPVLSLPVFQARVGQIAGVEQQRATVYTAAVCRVLKDAVPSQKLPGRLGPLFSFG